MEKNSEIRVFLKRHKIVTIILIISILCVTKFSKIRIFGWIPDFLANALICSKTNSDSFEIWSIMNNLSMAYISSLVFYIIVQYVPERKAEVKAFAYFNNQLSRIYDDMSYLINMYLFILGIGSDERLLTVESVHEIVKIEIEDKVRYCNVQHKTDKNSPKTCSYGYNIYANSNEKTKSIVKNIDRIFELPLSSNIEKDLVELLSNIKESSFMSSIRFSDLDNMKHIPGYTKGTIILGLDKKFLDFIKLHIDLGKQKIHESKYIFSELPENEIRKIKEDRFFMLGRAAFFRLSSDEIVKKVLKVKDIELNGESFNRINGVLLEMLFTYDFDKEEYEYLLPLAKFVSDYLLTFKGDAIIEEISLINNLQVIKRIGNLDSCELDKMNVIINDSEKDIQIRLGAAIILGDNEKATELFSSMSVDDKNQIIRFPIYRLWDSPPIPPDLEPPLFNFV